MSKDIINRNSKGKLHGYRERYSYSGNLWYKGFYHNGVRIDYEESYYWSGGELEKIFYI